MKLPNEIMYIFLLVITALSKTVYKNTITILFTQNIMLIIAKKPDLSKVAS